MREELMNKVLLIATAMVVGLAMTAPAKADRKLLQFLGEATDIGDLVDANTEAGTDIDATDILNEAGVSLPTEPGNFLGCHKVPLLDMKTKKQLGSGIDCLYGIEGGVAAVSFFILPGGSLVSAGLTSLGEFTQGVGDNPVVPGDSNSPSPVFVTGSIPDLTMNTIVTGTGQFTHTKGTARVSGAVYPGDNDGNFWFNCLWELNLERRGKTKGGNPNR
jgi:hypothetical protein